MKNKAKKQKGIRTVLEFSLTKIKIMQAVVKKSALVTHLICERYHGDSEQEIIDTLAKAIKTHHLAIGDCIVVLDRSLISIRPVKLPTVNEEEIKEMVKWQAAKSLPYSIDEIIVSYQIISSDEEGFSHVLVAIIPQQSIKKYVAVCDALHIQAQAFAISSEGLLLWYLRQAPSASPGEATALIDVEEGRFEMAVLYQGKLIFSRSFSLVLQDPGSQMYEKIIEDVKVSVDSYRKQEVYQPIKDLVLVGDTKAIMDIAPRCNQVFNMTARLIEHLSAVTVKKDALRIAPDQVVSFAAGCGFLLSDTPIAINLIPASVQEHGIYFEKKKQFFKTLTLAALTVIVCIGAVSFNFYSKKQVLKRLDIQLNAVNPTAQEMQTIKNKMSIIRAQLDNEHSCLEALREIHAITPKEIYLFTFIFEDGGLVIVKGSAPTMSSVFNFAPALNQSPFFENAQVRYATQRKSQRGELTDFEIACQLKGKPKG